MEEKMVEKMKELKRLRENYLSGHISVGEMIDRVLETIEGMED